jgi:hypothetical protein
MHPADAATNSFDRDLVLGLASFKQEGLYEIDAALERIDNGTYGVCELTGQLIRGNDWKLFHGLGFHERLSNKLSAIRVLASVRWALSGKWRRQPTTDVRQSVRSDCRQNPLSVSCMIKIAVPAPICGRLFLAEIRPATGCETAAAEILSAMTNRIVR